MGRCAWNGICPTPPHARIWAFRTIRFSGTIKVFDREWYPHTLLMSNEPLDSENIDESLFFQSEEIKALKNQVPFAKRFDKAYHQFKLIEIVDDREVREIASFVYPYWKG